MILNAQKEITNDFNLATANLNMDVQFGAGWFMTQRILWKGEFVSQNHNGFPNTDRFNGGNFNGFMIEAAVGF